MTMSAGNTVLWAQLRSMPGPLSLSVLATLVQQLAMLALPWCIQHALDDGITPLDVGDTVRWALVTAAVSLAFLLGGVGGQWWSGIAANRVAHGLRAALIDKVTVLDRPALARFGRGDLAMRVTRDVDLVRLWLQNLNIWVRVIVTLVVVLPALGLLDPLLLVVGLVTVPLVGLANAFFPGRYDAANEALSEAHSTRADAVEDLLSASAAVRGLGGERVLVRRHHGLSRTVTGTSLRVAGVSAWWSAVPPALPRLAIAVGLGLGGTAAIRGDLTVGGLVAFTSWMTTLALAIAILVDLLAGRGQARVAATRIAEVLDTPGMAADDADPVPLPAGGVLEAAAVVVRGEDGRAILGPVDLSAGPGEFVAITGPTGSGKSTLTRLLCRIDDPASGTLRFGGVDLRSASRTEVLTRIGLVPQRPLVLSGTVADNLRLGRDLELAELRAACHAAALDEFVMSLPDQYDTVLGERGGTLSGGQGQRLALARGLLGRPAVLVLDDVTSALDVETEAAVLRRLREWNPDGTLIVVSHRPAVLAAADRVVTLPPPDRTTTRSGDGAALPITRSGDEAALPTTGGHRG
ncbi:ABC-type multidrug transport system, ATPase and permease component [Frankia sp. EI5c]|uniref:ABC transporter ATP-binding protein n=1 Tax=Frankia sp. EI5c TaxID=683316 RepID=UPI0007C3279D|nr:ABC transporter ATP-binding protein [Frankia sp. EI5c]OAA24376.1 ABC-type multidrug transport system, ATPase and permease component [Frankia sp. EI5c]